MGRSSTDVPIERTRLLKSVLFSLCATVCAVVLTASCASDEDGGETPPEATPAAEPIEDTTPADPAGFPDIVAKVNGVEISKSSLLERATEIRSQIPPTEDTASNAFFGQSAGGYRRL